MTIVVQSFPLCSFILHHLRLRTFNVSVYFTLSMKILESLQQLTQYDGDVCLLEWTWLHLHHVLVRE
jgi:hypothetical protein